MKISILCLIVLTMFLLLGGIAAAQTSDSYEMKIFEVSSEGIVNISGNYTLVDTINYTGENESTSASYILVSGYCASGGKTGVFGPGSIVPEVSTIILLAIGLAGLGGYIWHCRRKTIDVI